MASKRWISLALLLGACGGGTPAGEGGATDAGLEEAARERGLVGDPGQAPLTGLYARATDRICIVERGGGARIGIVSDYGDGLACAAAGTATRRSEAIAVELGTTGDCRFDAAFDGERIVFPARLPDGCARFCSPRASMSAVSVERLSASASEASALRDHRDRAVCAS
ncbi:hypothetical protein [Sphingomonas sp. Y38-1Y]|uniref:hypothetical protein n=1 Tax=Sphingomonas sp. Y38-1Y TaxID=3078265 RepID=UPI0028E5C450|nr:hypothetical protein [Sphingomonas sp. Y38-1Y]